MIVPHFFLYLNPIDFRAPLNFSLYKYAKINSAQNRLFFTHLSSQKLMVREFLKYHFRPKYKIFQLHNFILHAFVKSNLKRKILQKPTR